MSRGANPGAGRVEASGAPSDNEAVDVIDRLHREGRWNPSWDTLAEMDPEWAGDYLATTIEPYESGVLSRREVELLCIAVDAACTHLYAPGVRRHIRAALALGVTPREILEVLKLSTTVGIHALNVGLPLLAEEAARAQAEPGR